MPVYRRSYSAGLKIKDMLTLEIGLTLAIIALTVALLVTDRLPIDLVALTALCILLLSGLVSPQDGFAGFSNPATITVAAMFVLSAGLHRSGALSGVAEWIGALTQKSLTLAVLSMMVVVATLSAFMNNTAVVALFLPLLMEAARRSHVSPSKLLIPLSFASMFGGACTLVGTSTNLLVSEVAERHLGQGLSMFELAPLGLLLAVVGLAYVLFVGLPMLPSRRAGEELTHDFDMSPHLTQVVLRNASEVAARPLREWRRLKDVPIDLLEVRRPGAQPERPTLNTALSNEDVLTVRTDQPFSLQNCEDFELEPIRVSDEMLDSEESALVEFMVSPGAELDGASLASSGVIDQGIVPLAIRHRGGLVHGKLRHEKLAGGDSVLVRADRDRLEQLSRSPLLMVSAPSIEPLRRSPWWPLAVLATVIIVSALEWLPIAVAAPVGCLAMVWSGCLTLEDAYRAIEWKVIVLLGGMLALGEAMQSSGTTDWLSQKLLLWAQDPVGALALVYLATIALTSVMSNNATAVLMAPLALGVAENLAVDPRPLLVAVALAASSCFATPIGYQTNVMVYGPGHYKFSDFVKVGLPLNLLFFGVSMAVIPRLWPL